MKQKHYDNGELITKPRMQDEPWYSDYQTLVEFAVFSKAKGKDLTNLFLKDYRTIFKKDYPNMEQLIRWSRFLSKK